MRAEKITLDLKRLVLDSFEKEAILIEGLQCASLSQIVSSCRLHRNLVVDILDKLILEEGFLGKNKLGSCWLYYFKLPV